MIDILRGTPQPQDWMALGGILTAAAVVGAAFYFLVYQGQLQEVDRIEIEDGAVVANLEKARQIERDIEKLKEETENIEILVRDFERRLPSKRELTRLQGKIEGFASQEEVKLRIRPRNAILDANKETIPYEIRAVGAYHKVASFINQLERYERYLKVSELSLSENDGETSVDFMLHTFIFIEDSAGGV